MERNSNAGDVEVTKMNAPMRDFESSSEVLV